MHVQLDRVSLSRGAQVVLEDVTLTIAEHARLGVVGPNGIGKSSLLHLVAGLVPPDRGVVSRAPESLAVGYLEQELSREPGETLRGYLRRRTGVAAAEHALETAATRLASESAVAAREYDDALTGYLAIGGADLDARLPGVCADLGVPTELEREVGSLSGGEAARLALAAILLSRFDVLLLDEPTNDLDFEGLERLERFVDEREGALVVISHDRAFLDRTVTRIAEIEPRSRGVVEWAGGWSEYAQARNRARDAGYAEFERSQARRRELTDLLSTRRNEARRSGAGLGERSGGSDRRGTNALRTKVRQAQRLLDRSPLAEKPFEPWELQLTLTSGVRGSDRVAALRGAVGERGSFRLGPVELEVARGDRLAITGRNGVGKSTLLAMLLGELPLSEGARELSRSAVIGTLVQDRRPSGTGSVLDELVCRTGLEPVEARTLLAKFGLGTAHVERAPATLSAGERTRLALAELQQRRVSLLVLDEPTNHLDLEAIEQLEGALAGYDGALVVVSHDRRFLEAIAPTRELRLG